MNRYRPYSTRKSLSRSLHTVLLVGMCASLLLGILAPMLNVSRVQAATSSTAPALAAPPVVERAPQAPIAASGTAGTADKPNTEILLSVYQDGTATFDTDPANDNLGAHTPGLDSGANNNVVRTYDLVTYRIDWNVNERDATNVTIRATLPVTMEWRGPGNRPVPSGCLIEGSSITGNNKRDLVCNLGDLKEGSAGAIYPQAFVGARRDNQKVSLIATIVTDQSSAVTSNSVETTISAAPLWDWVKQKPEFYGVTKTNGVTGTLFIWPITLQPKSGVTKGFEPLDDSIALTITDYYNQITPNTFRLTDGNIDNLFYAGGYVGIPSGRTMCGGYDGKAFPYGRNVAGASSGVNYASPGATITCSYHQQDAYKSMISIRGYNTSAPPPKNADGTANTNQVAIAFQIAFFAPFSELWQYSSLVSGVYKVDIKNTIGDDNPRVTDMTFGRTITPNPIPVYGSNGAVNESTIDNNAFPLPYSTSPQFPGTRNHYHWTWIQSADLAINNHPYFSQAQIPGVPNLTGPGNGIANATARVLPGFNPITDTSGKLFEGSNNNCYGTAINQSSGGCLYSGRGGVSRGQKIVMGSALGLVQSGGDAAYTGAHLCMWIDTRHLDMLPFPASIPANYMSSFHNQNQIISSTVRSPTHGNGAAIVLHGGRSYLGILNIGTAEGTIATPSYRVQFGKSNAANTASIASNGVTCNDSDANGRAWSDTPFVNGDGTLDYNMVRLITNESVPWRVPGALYPQPPYDGGDTNSGTTFFIMVQARVKDDVVGNPNLTPVYVHASKATDINQPAGQESAVNLTAGSAVNIAWDSKIYDQANEPIVGNSLTPGDNLALDPQALEVGGVGDGTGHWQRAHHDKVTIVGPGTYINKQNIKGLGQVVDVGDTITYSVKFGWNGASTEVLQNAYVTETIPTWAELIGHTQPVSTTSTAHTASQLRFNLGNQPGGYSDEFTVTLRVKSKQAANSALNNIAAINGDYAGSANYGFKSSTAAVYFTTAYQKVAVRKSLEQAYGTCSKDYEFFASKNGDVNSSNPKASGIENEQWASRCAKMQVGGDVTFTLHITNDGNVPLLNTSLIDLLPHNGDEIEEKTTAQGTGVADTNKLGDGRQPQSAFSGSAFVRKLQITSSGAYTVSYTSDAPAGISRDPRSNTSTWTVTCTGSGSGACSTIPTSATAYKVEMARTNVNTASSVNLVIGTSGNQNDDIYTSNFGDPVMGELSLPVRSNDVSAAAIPSTIRIIKHTVDGNGIFAFDSADPDLAALSLTTVNGIATSAVITKAPGVYTITEETLPSDWSLTGLACNGDLDNGSTYQLGQRQITLDLDIGENLICHVTNTKGLHNCTEVISADQTDINSTPNNGPDGENDDSCVHLNLQVLLGDRLWIEDDNDGLASTGIVTPVVGQLVTATSSSGVIYTATTDANGLYTITVPANTTYTVTTIIPTGYLTAPVLASDGSNPAGNNDKNHNVLGTPVVITTTDNLSIDFGFTPAVVKLGNRLWIESDTDGLATTGIVTPVIGQIVTATDGVNSYTATTDSNGLYTITIPANQTYTVTTGLPTGNYVDSAKPAGDTGVNPDTNNDKNHDRSGTTVVMTTTDNLSIDFGFTPSLQRFGDRLWLESDNDGNATTNFIGSVADHVVTATASTGTVYTTTTDNNGYYVFSVPAGVYTVTYGLSPDGYQPSTTPGGAAVSAASGGNDTSHVNGTVVTLNASEVITTVDFAFTPILVKIGDRLWIESDNDGNASNGVVTPVIGQVVTATDGATIYTTTTDSNGLYTITVPANKTYTVTTGLPSAMLDTPTLGGNTGSDPVGNNDKNHDRTGTTVVITTTDNLSIDFGFTPIRLSLGNRVWFDTNDDGILSVNEVGVNNVLVELYQDSNGSGVFDAGDTRLLTTTTNASGYYTFTGLTATTGVNNTYLVVIPASNFATGNALYHYQNSDPTVAGDSNLDNRDHGNVLNGALGNGGLVASSAITLTINGEPTNDEDSNANTNTTIDFGFYQVSVGNRFWEDRNNNGLRQFSDGNEPGVNGITVYLHDATTNALVATTVTSNTFDAEDGGYEFVGLISGTYYITFELPVNYRSTLDLPTSADPNNNVNGDDNGLGETLGGIVRSNNFTLTAGSIGLQNNNTVDNNTGITFDKTVDFGLYTPYPAITLKKYTNGADADVPSGPLLKAGDVVTWTYEITNTGQITLTNITLSDDKQGGITCPQTTLAVNAHMTCVLTATATSGAYSNTAVVSAASILSNTQIVTSTDPSHYNGYTAGLGDYVWFDANRDGLQGNPAIEPGVQGVTVTLYENGAPLATTTTDQNGFYAFLTLTVGVNYSVSFEIPSTYQFTMPNANGNLSDTLDSDAVTSTLTLASSPVIQLAANEFNSTLDAGVILPVVPMSLGNRLWFDVNDDGILGVGELGINAVAVELYQDSNSSGGFDAGDTLISTTLTANGGYYTFTNLTETGAPNQAYLVVITDTNFVGAGKLVGYHNSTPTVAGDSDLDNRDHGALLGVLGSNGVVASSPITLSLYAEPINDQDSDPNTNTTIDFGFYTMSFGNKVWEEAVDNGTRQFIDGNEPGVNGVEVRLYAINGGSETLVMTTTTAYKGAPDNDDGEYLFTGLARGQYRVEIVAPPFYRSATDFNLANDPNDNFNGDDNGVGTGMGIISSRVLTLTPGSLGANLNNAISASRGSTYDKTIDFGIYRLKSAIELKKYTNGVDADQPTGPTVSLGSTVTWTYNITNTGEVTLTSITLTDDKQGGITCPQSVLAPSTAMTCQITGTAQAGQYANTAVVTGTPTISNPLGSGNITSTPITDTDPSHYYGQPLSLGNRVWIDVDNNGLDDDGVSGTLGSSDGLGNVPMTLYRNGAIISTTLTDGAGYYTFTNLPEGVYTVTADLPVRYISSTPDDTNADNNQNGDDNGIGSNGGIVASNPITLTLGNEPTNDGDADNNSNLSVDFGAFAPQPGLALIKYTNGYDADTVTGPTLAVGSTVTWTYVIRNTGNVTLTDVTLSDDKLAAQNPLTSNVTLPVGAVITITKTGVAIAGQYTNTASITATNPYSGSGVITPTLTVTNPSHYFGADPSIAVRKYTNGEDADAMTGPIVRVGSTVTWTYVVTNTGNVALTDVTLTDDKLAGTITNGVTLQPGAVITLTKTGIATLGQYTNTAVVTGTYTPPTPSAPELPGIPTPPATPQTVTDSNPSHYIGLPLSLGNRVWVDKNNDGLDNDGVGGAAGSSTGLDNVTMTLYRNGSVISTTMTDGNGYYNFALLPEGVYTVSASLPAGYASSTPDDGNADNNENGDDNGLGSGVPSGSGMVASSPVTLAFNSEPTDDGDNNANSNLSVDFGVVGALTLGNYVWVDSNGNGTQDEPASNGKPGVTVTLTLPDGSVITTTTDSSGYYSFTTLLPNTTYTVTFVTPTDHRFTIPNQGSSTGDSDAPVSGVVVVMMGTTDNHTIDAGLIQPLNLGNYVWFDANRDGTQNGMEQGITGAVVDLFKADGVTPATDLNGATVPSQTTGSNGLYNFGNLPVGGYVVKVTTPAGYQPTSNQEADPNTDNNTDSNIVSSSGNVHSSDVVMLTVGGEPLSAVDSDSNNGNLTVDFGFVLPPAALGNYIWLDENADGQQDAGEPGIPNVVVNLTDSQGNLYTTTTDANGGYLFAELLPSTYTVTVNPLNFLPAGALEELAQTPLIGGPGLNTGDFGNKDDAGYPVTLSAGEENLSADFGYITNPTDVNNNDRLAALGDRVWVDVDKDGRQEPEEVGIEGVVMQLLTAGTDGVFGTADDVVLATDTTDETGNYLFTDLPAGAYIVKVDPTTLPAGFSQTGDPDHFGTPGAENDNMTTVPVILAPGDVFLNVDFGYSPNVGTTVGAIGDTVWLDADASGTDTMDADDHGIPGVTVALIKDLDGDGVWEAGEPIIATDRTNVNGKYLFDGLPLNDGDGDADYIVWVNDTDNVLSDLRQTYDQDSPLDEMSHTALSSGITEDLDQDFSYAPLAQEPGEGVVGDTVWFDTNGDGEQQPNELGIEGVIVELTLPNGDILTTVTDENGHYFFGGLPLDESYIVTVADENFEPGGVLEGMENTDDKEDDNNDTSISEVLDANAPIDLTNDFGYFAPVNGRVGNLVWLDTNADGNWDGANGADGIASNDDDEPLIAGVTLDLYRDLNGNGKVDAGEPKLGSTTTSSNAVTTSGDLGNYLFEGLPVIGNGDGDAAAEYVVDVTDVNGVLAGYWHSLGTVGSTNHSQVDPYEVEIRAAQPENLTADFGYYVKLASLGNYVWYDLNGNGLQDANEDGIEGVKVVLAIAYPNGVTSMITTTTDADGHYEFNNLLIDEDFNGDGAGSEPTFTIKVVTPAGYTPTVVDVNNNSNNKQDSDNHNGVTAQPVQGLTDVAQRLDPTAEQMIASYDFGFIRTASLGDKVWEDRNGDGKQDDNEPGIPNVTVVLQTPAGVITTTTDANGSYTFTNLLPGVSYTVTFTTPAGYIPTMPNAVNDDSKDSDGTVVTNIILTSGQHNPTIDSGFIKLVELGNVVWVDANGDGIQNEPGLLGVTVKLTKSDGSEVITTTDAGGYYTFTGLLPNATYTVTFVKPIGYEFTTQNATGSSDVNDSDAPVNGVVVVSLGNQNDYTIDAGLLQPASLGDKVWEDRNHNGLQDNDEPGIPNVTVTLTKPDGSTVTTTTDANGNYTITNLLPGVPYTVTFATPSGYTPTMPNGGADNLDSDGLVVPNIVLTFGQHNPTIDSGFYLLPVTVGDRVWYDRNGDGQQGDVVSEPGVPGVVATLYNATTNTPVLVNGNPFTDVTDATGLYLFENLPPGNYYVLFDLNTLPIGYQPTAQNVGADATDSDADATGKTEATGILSGGQSNLTLDLGIKPVVCTTGCYKVEVMAVSTVNGVTTLSFRVTSTCAHGISYIAFATNGATVISPTAGSNYTGSLGQYNVILTNQSGNPGFASVKFEPQFPEYKGGLSDVFTIQLQNFNTSTPMMVEIHAGNEHHRVEFQLNQIGTEFCHAVITPEVLPASLGDKVWNDTDADGVQDGAEHSIRGVKVELLNSAGNVISTTLTNVNGNYLFANLPPGDYSVKFTPPFGYVISRPDQGNDDGKDSDADPITGKTVLTTLVSGENDPTWDAGMYQPASLGDTVWLDTDKDGVQDAPESGVAGVGVSLFKADGTLVMTTTTNASGRYEFGGLFPGDYYVQFSLPAGYVVTGKDQGNNDAFDSDVDPATLRTPVTSLSAGEHDPTLDMGVRLPDGVKPASIGDTVWYDANQDGRQDGNEGGIPGVKVTLYRADGTVVGTTTTDVDGHYHFGSLPPGSYFVQFVAPAGYLPSPLDVGGNTPGTDKNDSDANPQTGRTVVTQLVAGENDPTWDAGFYLPTPPASLGNYIWYDDDVDGVQDDDELGVPGVTVNLYDALTGKIVASMVTSSDGKYLFENLAPGQYFVEFITPDGYVFTIQDQGGDGLDSDADPANGRTIVTTLVSGENDLSWDAGIYAPTEDGAAAIPSSQLGNYVWDDNDRDGIQDADEKPVPGVLVKLYDEAGKLIAVTYTDEEGLYLFPSLLPGEYYLEFVLPETYVISPLGGNAESDADSNASPDTGRTELTVLTPGESDSRWDAGIYVPPTALDEGMEPELTNKVFLPLIGRE